MSCGPNLDGDWSTKKTGLRMVGAVKTNEGGAKKGDARGEGEPWTSNVNVHKG